MQIDMLLSASKTSPAETRCNTFGRYTLVVSYMYLDLYIHYTAMVTTVPHAWVGNSKNKIMCIIIENII